MQYYVTLLSAAHETWSQFWHFAPRVFVQASPSMHRLFRCPYFAQARHIGTANAVLMRGGCRIERRRATIAQADMSTHQHGCPGSRHYSFLTSQVACGPFQPPTACIATNQPQHEFLTLFLAALALVIAATF